MQTTRTQGIKQQLQDRAKKKATFQTAGALTPEGTKVLQLEVQLEESQKSATALMQRALEAEAKLTNFASQSSSSTEASSALIEKLKADLAAKEAELQIAAKDVSDAQTDAKISSVDSEELKVIQGRYEQSRKRNEDQAVELGTLTAELESQRTRIREKEASWAEIKGVQESQVSVLQSQVATLKGELTSVKSFAADQGKFLTNLGEENAKLVGEIKRLKEQARVRDKQLQESVLLARDAIMREKKKREEWEKRMRQQQGGARGSKG